MLFRGYLPIVSGWAMAHFLDGFDVNGSSLRPFLLENSERVKNNALAMALKHERPFQCLASPIRKEGTARQLAERDGIEEGLVCIFSILDPCRTFSFRFQKGGPFVQSARRKFAPLFLLHGSGLRPHPCAYSDLVSHADPGLSQWARVARTEALGQSVRYTKHDNVFLWIEDMAKAQRFADRFASLNWPVCGDC